MNRIKQLREEKEENQYQLASILQTTQSTLSKWERGEYEPDFEMLIKIASHFNVSIDYIVGYTDNRNANEKINNTLLREYMTKRFNRVYTEKDMDIIDKILEMLEKYKE